VEKHDTDSEYEDEVIDDFLDCEDPDEYENDNKYGDDDNYVDEQDNDLDNEYEDVDEDDNYHRSRNRN
jgi:hypothetical protein